MKATVRETVWVLTPLFVLYILLAIPLFRYPIVSDSVTYLQLAESLKEHLTYSIDGVPNKTQPPLFSYSIAAFLFLFRDPILAIKSASLLFGFLVVGLTYFFARQQGISNKWSIAAALSVMLHPWFMYFGSINLPLSESLATLLLTAGLLAFGMKKVKHSLVYAGVLFGLALVTRIAFLFMVLPFLAWSCYNAWQGKQRLKNLLLLILSLLPLALWMVRNSLIESPQSVIGNYSDNLSSWVHSPYSLLMYVPIMLVTFSFLLLPLFLGFAERIRRRDIFYILVLLSFLAYVIALSFLISNKGDILNIITKRPRYLIPFLPIFSIVSFSIISRERRRLVQYAAAGLLITFILGALLNYGAIQNLVYDRHPFYQTLMVKSELRKQAIDWVNDNAADGIAVCGGLGESDRLLSGNNAYLGNYLRPGLVYIDLDANPSESTRCDMVLSERPVGFPGLSLMRTFGRADDVYIYGRNMTLGA